MNLTFNNHIAQVLRREIYKVIYMDLLCILLLPLTLVILSIMEPGSHNKHTPQTFCT